MSVAAVACAIFFAGAVAGLAAGPSANRLAGSLPAAMETGLTTLAGATLGWMVGSAFGSTAAFVVAIVAGCNGVAGGIHQIYNWRAARGWAAFVSDSTWAILGTSFGLVLLAINAFWPGADLVSDFSHRRNRHVYEGGAALKRLFAFTQGPVISNANPSGRGLNPSFLERHEELHIWQNRMFGPLFQLTYVVWGMAGLVWAAAVWMRNRDENFGSLLTTAAYFCNPFEYWAYRNDEYWPPYDAHPLIAYKRDARRPDEA